MASATQTHFVRIDRSGGHQSIQIPDEFALRGEEAAITQDLQGRLIIEAAKPQSRQSLSEMLATWTPLGEEDSMPAIEDLPPEPVEF
jgi:antitoxin VapB